MARPSSSSSLSSALAVVLVVVLAAAVECSAARPVPVPVPVPVPAQQQLAVSAAAAEEEDATTMLPDTLHEGTVLIPGLGRFEIGSHYIPDIGGLDHSIPAATHAQYMPGADDTWVPNPGFEVPNPFLPGAATP